MLISCGILVLASYVGPTASPDGHLNPQETRKQAQRIERSQPNYNYPEVNHYPTEQKPMSVREKAARGYIVVPDKFL